MHFAVGCGGTDVAIQGFFCRPALPFRHVGRNPIWTHMVQQEPEHERETIPVAEERVVVEKRDRVTERVRVRTAVREDEVAIDEPLTVEEIEVERVPVGRIVDGPVPVREEGDTTIIPVLCEEIVVQKRLKLVEEVRVTRRRSTRQATERITVRREEPIVERLDIPPGDPGSQT